MKHCIKIYKKTTLKLFLKLKMPEYLIYAPFEAIYHTVHKGEECIREKKDECLNYYSNDPEESASWSKTFLALHLFLLQLSEVLGNNKI